MPTHNFMIADVMGSLTAVCLFPLFVVLPGYAVAWLLDLFEFRKRTLAFRAALSIPLSISLCPIATYLAGRFGSMNAVWGLYGILWTFFLAVMARHWRPFSWRRIQWPQGSAVAAAILAGWMALTIFSLIDLQFGQRAYFSSSAFDFSVRTEFIHSISTTGIPPANPGFLPGHPVLLRYHYFWLLPCALVGRLGGALVSSRQAWIGGVVWCGFGFIALIALYFRLFSYRGPATFRRRAIIGIALAGVTGIDILPTALLWMLQAAGMRGVLPSMEWWNEQVDSFVYTGLWQAHHLSGLVACLTAFLLMWEASRHPTGAGRVRHLVVAGIALASAGGESVYVSCVFGVFLLIWTALAIVKRWWWEASTLVSAGAIGIVLFLPYLLGLRGPALGGPPVQFWVRPFFPVDALFRGAGVGHGWAQPMANGLLLPVNYFLELGFFLAAALMWWKKRRSNHEPLLRAELAIALMIATSVLICTFVRSSVIGNNDLGWRGFLVAQFGLLLWGVDVITDWGSARRAQEACLCALLVLGVASSAYDVVISRVYPLLADRGTVAAISWISPDRQFGKRNYAARQAYEWVAATTPANAIVQFNPHVPIQDTSALLYSTRQTLAADESCFSGFGGDPALCPALISSLNAIYAPKGWTASRSLDGICRALPIDIVVAKDTDPPWGDKNSWVWTQTPAFANSYMRLFRCGKFPAVTSRAGF